MGRDGEVKTIADKPENKPARRLVKPKKVGKYEIRGELGRGTCGVVYKGFDPFVRREVAIKISVTDPTIDPSKTRQVQRDFFEEAYAAGKLQHPHIVALFDAGMEADLSYIVMEYIEGETLLEYCRKGGKRLSTEKVLECMFKCCRALEYSHRTGVIHRDIKPSNIMLSKEGETKLMDFSIAEVTQNLAFTPEVVVGSPSYMSPEQVLKKPVGPQSDLYSLGTVMYQLLTGERPFGSDDVQQVFRDIVKTPAPLLTEKRPDLSRAISDIVEKALRKKPEERFQSGQEFGVQLTRIYDDLRYAESRLSQRENQDSLKGLNFFKGFRDEEINEIMAASTMLTFKPGTVVIKEGEIDNSFYIIVRGSVEVRKSDKLIVTLHEGDCFGEIGFLVASKRTASIIAMSEVLVLKVNAMLMETVSKECQLRYYKAFNETLIYRLALTSARLSAMK
ncbi:MAG TPA: serine/threonine-protein kinase [Gammaproteobacteria bacterium]|nr:serine/threonine-protein kinase [Gammaproteobacteria bacterium]